MVRKKFLLRSGKLAGFQLLPSHSGGQMPLLFQLQAASFSEEESSLPLAFALKKSFHKRN